MYMTRTSFREEKKGRELAAPAMDRGPRPIVEIKENPLDT